MALFTCRRCVSEEEHSGFVDEREEAEVACMLPCGFIDEGAFRTESEAC